MLTLAILQQEVKEWSSRNFPNNKPHHPLLGIIEELEEYYQSEHIEERKDALADTTIFIADYCWRNDIDLSVIEPVSHYTYIDRCSAKFCHYHLKGEQGIRHSPEKIKEEKVKCISNLLHHLNGRWCFLTSSNMTIADFLNEIVAPVWAKVKQRDWVNKPMTAATEVA